MLADGLVVGVGEDRREGFEVDGVVAEELAGFLPRVRRVRSIRRGGGALWADVEVLLEELLFVGRQLLVEEPGDSAVVALLGLGVHGDSRGGWWLGVCEVGCGMVE